MEKKHSLDPGSFPLPPFFDTFTTLKLPVFFELISPRSLSSIRKVLFKRTDHSAELMNSYLNVDHVCCVPEDSGEPNLLVTSLVFQTGDCCEILAYLFSIQLVSQSVSCLDHFVSVFLHLLIPLTVSIHPSKIILSSTIPTLVPCFPFF